MIDVKRFLRDHFKEPGGVVQFLKVYGADPLPNDEAVRKWFVRESLTGAWLGTLLAYLELDRGQPISLAPYLTKGE